MEPGRDPATAQAAGLAALAARLGHRFRSPDLIETALTHRSFANERGLADHYERLEFLGDAVLGLIAAQWLFETRPGLDEGQLSRLKSYLVSAPVLAAWGERLGIGPLLRLGVGEERSGGRVKGSLLADAVEALFGAVLHDGGFAAARAAVEPLLAWAMEERPQFDTADAKSRLQEATQALGGELPVYRHVAERGPDHQKRFTAECWVAGRQLGEATARSKKLAEQHAAVQALRALEEHRRADGEACGGDPQGGQPPACPGVFPP